MLAHRDFAGISVVYAAADDVVNALVEELTSGPRTGRTVHLLTTHSVAEAHRNIAFFRALEQSSWVIPDGRWLQLLTSWSRRPLRQLRGQDLFLRFKEATKGTGLRHYFLLSRASLLETLQQEFSATNRSDDFAGGQEFPFGTLGCGQKASIRQNLSAAGADVVWFGISSPRQNIEAQWVAREAEVTVICVGAALEFVAGAKPVAPRWVQSLGAEWLFRLFTEPRRLGRRYLFDTLALIKLLSRFRKI